MKSRKSFFIVILSLFSLFLASIVVVLYQKLDDLVEATREKNEVSFVPIERSVHDNNAKDVLPSFREVSQKVMASVVYVETEVSLEGKMPKDKNHRFVPRSSSVGSGVIISSEGFILTNHHVIEGSVSENVTIVLNDNRSVLGRIIGSDPSTDLAVVQIRLDQIQGMVIGNSDEVAIGDWALAVGNPFRLRSTVTAGIISALGRDVSIIDDQMRIENFIQTDAAINKGNSGGALVNQYGELIGINTAIATQSGSYEGYGFAIPVNLAIKIARDIIEFGEVHRAFLGVQIASITQRRAKQLNLNSVSGVEIVGVIEHGAAYEAGIKEGDVVLAINDKMIAAHNELQAKIAEFRPGDTVSVSLWNHGDPITKAVRLQGAEAPQIQEWLGSTTQTEEENRFSDQRITMRNEFYSKALRLTVINRGETNLLFIQSLDPESAFFESGLREGDQLVELNGKTLESFEDFKIRMKYLIGKKQLISLKIKRDNEKTGYYVLDSKDL